MKSLIILAFFSICGFNAISQINSIKTAKPDSTKKLMTVETACGLCKFEMKDKGCNLAVRIDGRSYFVDGTSIDDHGDAHADDGFCNSIRKAEVQGEIINGRFKATYFKLVKPEPKKEVKKTGGG
jgi:hypothetical protein